MAIIPPTLKTMMSIKYYRIMDGGKAMLLSPYLWLCEGTNSIHFPFLLVQIFPTLGFWQDLTEVRTTQLESSFLSASYMFLITYNEWHARKSDVSNFQLFFFLRFYLYIFRERGGEGEKHWCERETAISCFSHMPQPGTKPATQAHTLIGNQDHDLSLWGMTSNQLSHIGQGSKSFFFFKANMCPLYSLFFLLMN